MATPSRHVRFEASSGASEVDVWRPRRRERRRDRRRSPRSGGRVAGARPSRQLCSLVFTLQGVATGALGGGAGLAILRRVAGAEATGVLPPGSSGSRMAADHVRPGEVVAKLALRARRRGARRRLALRRRARREAAGRGPRRVPPPRGPRVRGRVHVSHTAAQVGVRESRRIVGRHRLTRAEVLGGRRSADGIARAAWPIELWREGTAGASYEYLADGDWYDVPIGCLRATATRTSLAAGRCISGDSDALGSARVIGTCLATGVAAGRGSGPDRRLVTLVDRLRASAERHPTRPAVTDVASGRSCTHAALVAEVDVVAADLRAAGVAAPQRIALVGANSFA